MAERNKPAKGMNAMTELKEELTQIRLALDRKNPYVGLVLDELQNPPFDDLRAYLESIAHEDKYYNYLLRTI